MQSFDVVIPNNNEQQLIDRAIKLGYSELVLLTRDINYKYENSLFKIRKAYLLKNTSELQRARKMFDFVFAIAERGFFEQEVDFIIKAELSDRRDSFHYRSTSLNQVHAKLTKEKDSCIVFNFDILLNSDNRTRQLLLGRMFQNAALVKKYRLKSAVFTLASTPEGMRSRTILDALGNVLGT
jgi:hypothetical protein